MIRRVWISAGVVLVLLSGSLFWYGYVRAPGELPTRSITLTSPGGQSVKLDVEVADEVGEWERGLMGRRHLREGGGMLFVFPSEAPRDFWMKNTLIPLTILYFDGSGKFVSRTTMTPCERDPCPTYPSHAPAQYALEVNQGERGIEEVGAGWVLTDPR